MKWWGWGEEGVSFQHKDKPTFAGFVKSAMDIDASLGPEPVQDLAQMVVPPTNVPSQLISELQRIVGIPYVRQESLGRVVHAYGKGLRDLVRIAEVTLGGCRM
jgi:alkyldihydroxyacetonephosphate synthase